MGESSEQGQSQGMLRMGDGTWGWPVVRPTFSPFQERLLGVVDAVLRGGFRPAIGANDESHAVVAFAERVVRGVLAIADPDAAQVSAEHEAKVYAAEMLRERNEALDEAAKLRREAAEGRNALARLEAKVAELTRAADTLARAHGVTPPGVVP